MNLRLNSARYKSTLKSADTEEFIDLHFYRPIGYLWALFFNKLGLVPNQITIASIFIGIASGICFYFTDFWLNLLGVFLLIWANTYDSADGQLARMTGKKSELGRILDGACGDFWFLSIYIAIICRLWPQWNYWILILALCAAYFHSRQAAMGDYYRNVHLLFLKGKNGSELDNSRTLAEKYGLIKWKEKPLLKFFEKMYLAYTIGQEKWTRNLQKMMEIISEKYDGSIPSWMNEEFCKKSFPLLKYTNMLSFNLRSIILFISVLTNYPWIYFLFEITIMNGMLVYMIYKYEYICGELAGKLKEV
jgi:hypothetical protein